jgi:hypothetical protein
MPTFIGPSGYGGGPQLMMATTGMGNSQNQQYYILQPVPSPYFNMGGGGPT